MTKIVVAIIATLTISTILFGCSSIPGDTQFEACPDITLNDVPTSNMSISGDTVTYSSSGNGKLMFKLNSNGKLAVLSINSDNLDNDERVALALVPDLANAAVAVGFCLKARNLKRQRT